MTSPYRPEPPPPCEECGRLHAEVEKLTAEVEALKNPKPQLPKQPWWRMLWRAKPEPLSPPSRVGRVWESADHTFMVFDGKLYARRTLNWRNHPSSADDDWIHVESGLFVNVRMGRELGYAIQQHVNTSEAAERAARLKKLSGVEEVVDHMTAERSLRVIKRRG